VDECGDDELKADAATGQVIDPSFEEEAGEESAPADLPRAKDGGAVDRDGTPEGCSFQSNISASQ
jgi:hypothetical protein